MSASTDPVYLRVLEDLRTRIREGNLEPGARVPSRNAIIARYGVGETAAKHALQVLATEGLIEARAGSGSYVRAMAAARHLEHDRLHYPGSPFGLADSPGGTAGQADGQPPEAHRVSWEHQTQHLVPPAHIARRVGLAPGAPATVTRYLLTSDGEPVQLALSYEPPSLTEGTAAAMPEDGPLAGRGVVERMRSVGIEVDQVLEELSVRSALLAEAGALGIPPGAPVLLVERVHLAGARAVEACDIVIAADRFRLRYRFGAGPGGRPGAGWPRSGGLRGAAWPGGAAVMIRPARPGDVPAICRLVRELADYERALAEVQVTEADLRAALFGPEPAVFAHVAEHESRVAGFALWFLNYSTWTGRHGIYLEDLYVTPELRRSGLGRALLAELAGICVRRGYGRLEWSVLDWNSPALEFYASLGAAGMDEWTVHRLAGDALRGLAADRPAPRQ